MTREEELESYSYLGYYVSSFIYIICGKESPTGIRVTEIIGREEELESYSYSKCLVSHIISG
jgi:hypothetical protein